MKLAFFVLTQYRLVTDGRTDRIIFCLCCRERKVSSRPSACQESFFILVTMVEH